MFAKRFAVTSLLGAALAAGITAEAAASICVHPSVPEDTELVLVTIMKGDKLSTVSLGGQTNATGVVDVSVPPGDKPLYLLFGSYDSTIWRISGNTERVFRAIGASIVPDKSSIQEIRVNGRVVQPTLSSEEVSAVGFIGLPPERVANLSHACLPAYGSRARLRDTVRTRIVQAVGRLPDRVLAGQSPLNIDLADGDMKEFPDSEPPVPTDFDPEAWGRAIWYRNGGIAKIDASQVISEAQVEPYIILPGWFGVSQLVSSGQLRPFGHGKYLITSTNEGLPEFQAGQENAVYVRDDDMAGPPNQSWPNCIMSRAQAESGVHPSHVCGPPPSVGFKR